MQNSHDDENGMCVRLCLARSSAVSSLGTGNDLTWDSVDLFLIDDDDNDGGDTLGDDDDCCEITPGDDDD